MLGGGGTERGKAWVRQEERVLQEGDGGGERGAALGTAADIHLVLDAEGLGPSCHVLNSPTKTAPTTTSNPEKLAF